MEIIPSDNPYDRLDGETLSSLCRLRSAQLLDGSAAVQDATDRLVLMMDIALMLLSAAETMSTPIGAGAPDRQGGS